MRITIILNGISRNKRSFYKRILPGLADKFDVEVLETSYSGHAEELARQATVQNALVVLAAGGDGTLNQVINGVVKSGATVLPTVGLIPLGSGNDFGRTCGLFPSSDWIIQLLRAGQPKPTDIGEINCKDRGGRNVTRYFINACSMGMGPEVVKRLATSGRAWGPSISYLTSIISVFFTHHPQEIRCKTSSWEWAGVARVIAIANGKSFGNALYIAPDAAPDDGVFNTFIAGELPLWRFLYCLQAIKSKSKIRNTMIHYQTAKELKLTAPEECLLEAEGEMAGFLPATIKVLPGKINFLR